MQHNAAVAREAMARGAFQELAKAGWHGGAMAWKGHRMAFYLFYFSEHF